MTALKILIFALTAAMVQADQLHFTKEQFALLTAVREPRVDKAVIKAAILSEHHAVKMAGLKALLIHRAFDVWPACRDDASNWKGNAAMMVPVISSLAEGNARPERPLILQIEPGLLEFLERRGTVATAEYRDGERSLAQELLDVFTHDVLAGAFPNDIRFEAASKLLKVGITDVEAKHRLEAIVETR